MSSSSSPNLPAPAIGNLKFLKGTPISLNNIKGNNILLLESWATWCPPCRNSIPHLTSTQEKYIDRGLIVLGVSNESESTVKPFIENMGDKMNYRVAIGDLSNYSAQFQVQGIPHAFLIDHNLIVRYSGHPMQPELENKIDILCNELKLFKLKQAEQSLEIIPMRELTPEHLETHSIGELKNVLKANHIDPAYYLEKGEMIKALLDANKQQSTKIKSGVKITSKPQEMKAEPVTNLPQCDPITGSCSIPPHSGTASETTSSGIELSTVNADDLEDLPISTLKKMLKENNIDMGKGAIEKSDIIKEILKKQQTKP